MSLGAAQLNTLTRGRGILNRYGNPFFASGQVLLTNADPKIGNSSVDFAGSPRFLETTVNHQAIDDLGENTNWTFEGFWSPKFTTFTGFQTLVRTVQEDAVTGINISFRGFGNANSGAIEYSILDVNNSNTVNFNGGITFDPNEWYHWAVVKSQNSFFIYHNGTRISSRTGFTALYRPFGTDTLSRNLRLGGPLNPLNARQDEFRISRIARYTGTTLAVPTALSNDASTVILLQFEGAAGTQEFRDTHTAF